MPGAFVLLGLLKKTVTLPLGQNPGFLSQLLRVAAGTAGGRDVHQIKNRPGFCL